MRDQVSDQSAVMPTPLQPLGERERSLRHRVQALRCRLHRSRRDEERYMIFDLGEDAIAAGHAFELTLDDVAAWIDDRNEVHPNP